MSEMKGFDSISTEDKERLALTGIQTDSMEGRAGSFLLVNDHVLHAMTMFSTQAQMPRALRS